MNRPTRYAVVAGGGTAGHVLPALAVARALAERGHEPASIELVGSRRGQERILLADVDFPVTLLPGRGISRRLSLADLGANVVAIAGIVWAMVTSLSSMLRRRPEVVVSVGGYASVPSGMAAVVLGVPLVLVNVDAVPGLAHRVMDRFSAAAAVAFAGTALRRAVVTGAPVRPEVAAVERDPSARQAAREALGIPVDRALVATVGGSLGARRVNEAAAGLAERWADRGDLALYQVVGRREWERFGGGIGGDGPDGGTGRDGRLWVRAVPFENEMPLLYSAVDIIVCRSGAMTVSELSAAGVPAVLVPLPGAPGDHQTANARALADAGAGFLVADAECTPERLASMLGPVLEDPARLEAMGSAARGLGRPEAAAAVAEVVDGVVAARGR